MQSPFEQHLAIANGVIDAHGETILWALLVWNAIVFIIYGIDKMKAESGAWRIPESALLTYAFFGASPGALLACQLFRHKIRKASFFNSLITIAVIHMVLAGVYIGLSL